MEKEKMISRYKKFFNNQGGLESTILAIIVLAWIAPILLTYFILKFGIIIPIGNLLGGRNK
tara:strand:+ start:608 stop:790 length:183 start_codon:yes stop_codon:yes gene_type:complete